MACSITKPLVALLASKRALEVVELLGFLMDVKEVWTAARKMERGG